MRKQILSTVFSILLSFILAISLLIGSLCFYANETVCKSESLTDIAVSKGYTQELYDQIVYAWENYMAITGVSEPDPIMTVLTPEKVQADVLEYINASEEIDTTTLRKQLEQKVREYVSNTIGEDDLNAELEANINELVSACMQTYSQSITIPMLPKILSAASNIQRFLFPAGLFAFGFGLIISAFIFFLQRKRKNTLYYASIATATNAILFLAITCMAEYFSLIARLPIEESALRTLLTSYLQFLLDKLQIVGFAFLAATAMLLLVYLLFVYLEKQESKELLYE